ncbi:MAG: DUF6029 family protein [Ignavibacteriaceae bacterium]
MKIAYLSSLLLITIFLSNNLFAQFQEDWFLMPDGLGLSNQLEYSYDIKDKKEILENWFNLDYTKGIFSAGLRFDVFQPNDPDPSINRGKLRYADIAYKYLKADIGDFDKSISLTAGNFYALFGRGLILKSYEERNIRVDNNLLGVKAEGRYMDFILTALTGMPENALAQRKDILHAVDLEYRGFQSLKIGGSFASNQSDVEGIARTTVASLRVQPSVWNFNFYAEYGIKQNEDIKKNVFNDDETIIGEAFYGSMDFYIGSFSVVGEVKHYDNFAFTTNDGTVFYNTPPSLRKEYTYQLLNRHPSPLEQSNERGFQVEANYNLDDDNYYSANFGLTETLPHSSYFQTVNGFNLPVFTQHKEIFVQANRNWSDKLSTILAFGYNEELQTNTKNFAPIIEQRFYFGDVNTLKIVIEHQHTTNRSNEEKYYSNVLALEYLRSPSLSISLVTEVETKEPVPGGIVRKLWSFIRLGYKVWQSTDLSLLIGSRQAGNICIGGVCRFEPEFRGIEFNMLTRF